MTSPSQLAKRMGQVRHFSELSEGHLAKIIEYGSIHQVDGGTTLFWEGDACAGLYVLLEGEIHLEKIGPELRRSILFVLDEPMVFNEVSVLDNGLNPVTATAAKASQLWHASQKAFHQIMKAYPAVAFSLLYTLASHNRLLVEEYEDMCFRPVRARAAKLLLDLSGNGQTQIERRDHGNEHLAARISTVPEAFSRALGFFRTNGYLDADRSTITILEPDSLTRMAKLEDGG